MINDLKEKELTKKDLLIRIKDKLRREKEEHLRKVLSEKSFEVADWSKYLAYQLGFLAAIEELDRFVPDPDTIKQ